MTVDDDTADDMTLQSDSESKETLSSDPCTVERTVTSGKKRPLFKFLKKSQDHTIGHRNKRPKSNNSHAINDTAIQPGEIRLKDPEAIWAHRCPWLVSPPSEFFKDNVHPLALLWRKNPYIPGHSYISVQDQKEVRQSLLTIWQPRHLLSAFQRRHV